MKRQITAVVIIASMLSFVSGYYISYKRDAITDEQLKEYFEDNIANIYIDVFFQNEIYTTYHVAKILQSIRDNRSLYQNDIDSLELILKNNAELFDKLYSDHPGGLHLSEKFMEQQDFIKQYRSMYMQE